MISFEYKFLREYPDKIEEETNKFAKEGWRLTVYEPYPRGSSLFHVIMERQISEHQTQIKTTPISKSGTVQQGMETKG